MPGNGRAGETTYEMSTPARCVLLREARFGSRTLSASSVSLESGQPDRDISNEKRANTRRVQALKFT